MPWIQEKGVFSLRQEEVQELRGEEEGPPPRLNGGETERVLECEASPLRTGISISLIPGPVTYKIGIGGVRRVESYGVCGWTRRQAVVEYM